MNERQTQELSDLQNLQAAGKLEETQKGRLEELTNFKALFEKAGERDTFEKDFKSAEAQKEHFREKFEKEEVARKAAEAKANDGGAKEGLKVEDFIDISASLEGLDQSEKIRIAREHKLSGKPLAEIRKDEDFLLWQSAYRAKVEKDKKVIIPANKQIDENAPISLEEALAGASTLAEKEEILQKNIGYNTGKRSSSDRVKIG